MSCRPGKFGTTVVDAENLDAIDPVSTESTNALYMQLRKHDANQVIKCARFETCVVKSTPMLSV